MFKDTIRPKKRLFLALILLSTILLSGVIYVFWKLMLPGLHNISFYLPIIVGSSILILIFLALLLISVMVLAVMGFPMFKALQGAAWSFVIFLFPLAIFIGKVFGIEKERTEQSFIELSNHLFKQRNLIVPGERILLLLPHCLQLDTCIFKITQDVNNCKQCGNCTIGELLRISKKYGVHMSVVPGGTLARRVVIQLRPKVVLAVACERDLTSGIQDVFPLPVFGVFNERPCGPCFNTRVDTVLVEDAIKSLTGVTDETK